MQDKLFSLIKSMTTGEKSHFTRYARLNTVKEKPEYLRLFEFLDAAWEYDETALKAHFKDDKFIKQLSRKKTQLKDKIMESLSVFHANRTAELSLRLQMSLLPVLYDKAVKDRNLVKTYEELLKKIKKVAKENECFSVLIDLFVWERKLMILEDTNKHDKHVLSLLAAREVAQDRRYEELKMEGAAIRTELLIIKDPKIKKPENRKRFESTILETIENTQPEQLSLQAKRHFFYAQSAYYSYLGDWEAAHTAAKNLIDTYSEITEGEHISKEHKKHLCRYLVIADYADNYDYYISVISMLKLNSSDEDMGIFNTIHFKMLIYYLNNHQIKSAIEVAENIERRWGDLCLIIEKRRKLAYCHNITVAYWFGDKIEPAIYWLSKILNFENVEQGQRFVNNARIIQLPIYYDYEDINLDNRIESTRKVLTKKGELNEYRQLILAGFRKLIRCADKHEKHSSITELHHKLIQIKKEHNINAADLECLLLWCERKTGKIELKSTV